jgi:glycosyltransferase involved in cell wall biosynthesis
MKIFVVSAFTKTMRQISSGIHPPLSATFWKVSTFKKNLQFKNKAVWMMEEGVNFLRLLVHPGIYKKEAVIICEYCHYSVLLFGKWLGFFGSRKPIYLINFYIHGYYNTPIVRKILGFLLTENVGLMAYSSSDREYFKTINPKADIRFAPWSGEESFEIDPLQKKDDDYIFAGGYANRDYDLVIRCARKFPHQQFIIVCSKLNVIMESQPSNVCIIRDVSKKEYHTFMANSMATIIPLKNNVGSSGQMAAIASMQFGKITFYPDFDMVSQYFENEKSGFMYRAGDADSLSLTLSMFIKNPSKYSQIGHDARLRWETYFKPDQFERKIGEHMKDFMEQRFPDQD